MHCSVKQGSVTAEYETQLYNYCQIAMQVEICEDLLPVPNFTFIEAEVWEYSLQNFQNFEFQP